MNLNLCAVIRCTDEPFLQRPLLLCRQHALMVSLNVTDILHANALAGTAATGLDIERVSIASDRAWSQPSHHPVVYFMVNGDRVKIGVSTNISARTSALCLRKENAVLLLQGGYELEGALHQAFHSDRLGQSEWFVLSHRIQDYIARRKEAEASMRQPVVAAGAEDAPLGQVASATPPKRPATAEEKILKALDDLSEPLDLKAAYQHKDQIAALADVQGPTLDNTLSRLIKAEKIHRQIDQYGKVLRGMYGLGSAPKSTEPGVHTSH